MALRSARLGRHSSARISIVSIRKPSPWAPRVGWALVTVILIAFGWGLSRRQRLETEAGEVVRMLFVPSVEQGTLVERGDELARFIRQDSGLILRTEVPTSYAAVIQALGSEQADVAWMPAFAYVIANARYGAEAKLQVVRSLERQAVLIVRVGSEEPKSLAALAGRRIAVPRSLREELQAALATHLNREAPGWEAVSVDDDREAVRQLVQGTEDLAAAASSYVASGPHDFVGDGRKLLASEHPEVLKNTRILFTTEETVSERSTVYYGCVYARTDSGVSRLSDLRGRSFAFSDETSTSGHIFPRLLLERRGVGLGRVYYAGGHPNVVQAVWDGKAVGGSAFYSPPSEQQLRDGLPVGDARYLLMKRMNDAVRRRELLEQIRILALTDPIPNDLCAVRRDFPEATWETFHGSLLRFLQTPAGREAFFDLLAGVAVETSSDSAFDGFRSALEVAGMDADSLLAAEERKLEKRRGGDG